MGVWGGGEVAVYGQSDYSISPLITLHRTIILHRGFAALRVEGTLQQTFRTVNFNSGSVHGLYNRFPLYNVLAHDCALETWKPALMIFFSFESHPKRRIDRSTCVCAEHAATLLWLPLNKLIILIPLG